MNGCDGYFTQEKRSFVFKGKNTEEPSYSFIVNKKWLLFYFREPTRSSRQRREQQLQEMFGERLIMRTKSKLNEWTVKVISESEARFLMDDVLRPEFS